MVKTLLTLSGYAGINHLPKHKASNYLSLTEEKEGITVSSFFYLKKGFYLFSIEKYLILTLQQFVKILINYILLKQFLTFILKYDTIYTG